MNGGTRMILYRTIVGSRLQKGRFNSVLDVGLASVLPSMSWQEAHDETFNRMNILGERNNL